MAASIIDEIAEDIEYLRRRKRSVQARRYGQSFKCPSPPSARYAYSRAIYGITKQMQSSKDVLNLDGDTTIPLTDTLADAYPDQTLPTPDELTFHIASRAAIERTLARLPLTWGRVLIMLYGLDGGPPRTQEQAARVLGISDGRVSQIKEKALRSLRYKKYDSAQLHAIWQD